jgi:hypothetical protein
MPAFAFDKDLLYSDLKQRIDNYEPGPDARDMFATIISESVNTAMLPLIAALNEHTHTTSAPGSPTGPPTP